MDKQLQKIQEENVKNKRPKSAKNPQKYTDKYTKLDEKHKGIKKELKNYKTGNESDAQGGYNNFFKVNDKIGVIKSNEDDIANKEFNSIFITSLLKICGETTIDSGKEQTNIYVDLAKNDLWDETKCMLDKYSIDDLNIICKQQTFNKLLKKEQTQLKYFLFTYLFSTHDFWEKPDHDLDSLVICNFLSNNLKEQKELWFVSRWLCKIFLFQMFDRKPENVVVMEDKDGEIDFCEIDFDDNQLEYGNDSKGFASNIFCKFVSQSDKLQKYMNLRWHDRLRYLKGHYDNFIIKSNSIKTSFAEMIKNYTMTPQKIEELIRKTALKAKYMGLSEQEVIDGINAKIELWKEMLNDQANGKIVNQIPCVKKAREKTLEALNQITKEKDKVEGIVHKIMMMHDLAYDKPDERKIKDDNDFLKDYLMKDVKLSHEEVNEHIAMRRKDNIKKFKEEQVTKIQSHFRSILARNKVKKMKEEEARKKIQSLFRGIRARNKVKKMKEEKEQVSHINNFIQNGRGEIDQNNISADSLISYFKQEKDRSRSFFWMFGQRNKRFNALCEELEKLWKEKSNNGIRIDENFLRNEDNMERDENLIRSLFQEQQQGNNVNQEMIHNNRPQLTTKQVKQRIVDRLSQVGCCSCV